MTKQLDVGSWGLFCGSAGRQIVLIDGVGVGPSSARKCTRRVPRELLLDEDRVAEAYRTGRATDEIVARHDETWRVVLRPMRSPLTSTVIGVLATVSPDTAPLPEPPVVGMWEWEIARDEDGQPTTQRRTYWNRDLFDIYDVAPEVASHHQGYWETGTWANELIDHADRVRVNASIRAGIEDGLMGVTGVVRCLTYNVVTGYGSEDLGRKHLRLVGTIAPIERRDSRILLQGFSYEVPDDFHDMSFERDPDAGRVDGVLRGVLDLAKDPTAVVDRATLDIVSTSPSWRDAAGGTVLNVVDVIARAEDVRRVRSFIEGVRGDDIAVMAEPLLWRCLEGKERRMVLSASGTGTLCEGEDVVVRFTDA